MEQQPCARAAGASAGRHHRRARRESCGEVCEGEQLERGRLAGRQTWVETREDAIAGELVALWTRSRELTAELLRLWTADETQSEGAPTLRSGQRGGQPTEASWNAAWAAYGHGESYLGSQEDREREAREDWLSDEGRRDASELAAP